MALFLVLMGISGSILVWEEELDSLLNPSLLQNQSAEPALHPTELIQRVALNDTVQFDFLTYPRDAKRSAIIYVSGLQTSRGPANQLLVDRNNGQILGARNTIGPNPFRRSELIPWLYQFHYSLTAGSVGVVLLGVVACVWFTDSLIAWVLTLPRRFSFRGWQPAWHINKNRLAFDTHRATGLWLTPVFVVLAFTGIYFNLYGQIFLPAVNTVSSITPQPYQQIAKTEPVDTPAITYADALILSYSELRRRGVQIHALGYLSWNPQLGYYVSAFYTDRDLSRDTPSAHVYLNHDGTLRHMRIIGQGTAGDLLVDWQFPLHSGQVFGLTGRIIVFFSGLALAIVSAMGLVVWWRKLRARSRPRKSYETGTLD